MAGPAVFGVGDGGGEGEDGGVVGGGGGVDAEEPALLRGGRLVMVSLGKNWESETMGGWECESMRVQDGE